MLWFALIVGFFAVAFAAYLARSVLSRDEGTPEMKEVAAAIRSGANAYMKRQYGIILLFFSVVFIILMVLSSLGMVHRVVPFTFLIGGLFSGATGYIGMSMATRANVRTANAARKGLNIALRTAFSSGAVMGLIVVGFAIINVAAGYLLLEKYASALGLNSIEDITSVMLTFSMGASFVALFARVGGGIFTKAADVGADLVGKLEKGIPEDDPRNPAVIADNVGDNVGDVAGMGADLYESYVGAMVAAMALAVSSGLGSAGILLPLGVAAAGALSSIVGVFFVRSGEETEQHILLLALRKGIFASAIITALASYFIVRNSLGAEHIGLYYSILIGLAAGIFIGLTTEYYTSSKYSPTIQLAESAKTGAATVIISGLSLGMQSAALPVLIVSVATLGGFFAAGGNFSSGLGIGIYGIGLAAVGMLSTLGITLATDAYGPVADNAGGIAQMTHQPPIVRKRTDALDALGNTTAATGKGFAIGSAALTALALIATLKERSEILTGGAALNLSVMNPKVVVGLMIGGAIPFLFSAFAMRAVGRAASAIVEEVRDQFKKIKGIMQGRAKPDYARCVSISTAAAQKEMIIPTVLAVVAPILTGILFGLESVFGLLLGALASGFVLAVMMSNAGGAWDNAKKYIEEGNYGGKGSESHKASVVGDTVGDPFKDTAGPSINILIKLMSTVSLVFLGAIIANALM